MVTTRTYRLVHTGSPVQTGTCLRVPSLTHAYLDVAFLDQGLVSSVTAANNYYKQSRQGGAAAFENNMYVLRPRAYRH